jgi:DNA-directed RNA polymerase specialized sigma24 family protein
LLSAEEAKRLLKEFLQSKDEQKSDQVLESLLHDFAAPIVNTVLRRKLGVDVLHLKRLGQQESEPRECPECKTLLETNLPVCPLCGSKLQSQTSRHSYRSPSELDAEDLLSDVLVALIERFRQWKERPQNAPIDYLPNYIIRLTLNIIALHWRQQSPHYHQLRNKLLYLLEGRGSVKMFALWDGNAPGEQLCGFFDWRGKPRCHSERYWIWCSDPHRFVAEALPYGTDPQKMDMAELLAHVFNWVGGPMEFDDLLAGLQELLGIQSVVIYSANPDEIECEESVWGLAEAERRVIDAEGKVLFTMRLWEGLKRLPVNQRRAFLLHFDREVWETFISHGCCTWKGIAEFLGMSIGEVKDLVGRLPLSDEEIARMLKLPNRQKVINLRHAALKSLKRWMRQAL